MKKNQYLLFLFLCIISCRYEDSKNYRFEESMKTTDSDLFKNTIVESDYFEIDPKEDNVLEGKEGTVIFIPQGAFLDKYGKPVLNKVSFELARPNSLSEMLLSNLTTTTNGAPHHSEAMLYVSAQSGGQPVFIDPANSLYIEIATDAARDGMLVYHGERVGEGKMNWIAPEPLENWLITVDLDLLNFYPPGFEKQVESGMPFRHYKEATQRLKDSLYYSLNNDFDKVHRSEETDSIYSQSSHCVSINPASIKVLKQKQFQNTLVATKAFERRLQSIYGTCNQEILELYIDKSDRNLWEIDSIAASMLGSNHPRYKDFINFYEEKLTRVQNTSASQKLSTYYNNQLKKVEKDLFKVREAYNQLLRKKEKEAEEKRQEYETLLGKRQVYRMEKFGFNVKKLGYYNVVKIIKQLDTFELSVHVENGAVYDRCHVYIVNPIVKSLFAMISLDTILFDRGYEGDKYLLMWKEQQAVAIVVAYKDEQVYYAAQSFSVQKINNLQLQPMKISMKALKDTLNLYRRYSRENKIMIDLEYQHDFYKEKKRQEQLLREQEFIDNLHRTVFDPCCPAEVLEGKKLFENNCLPCHCKNSEKIGPALKNISSRRPNEWVIRFVRNSRRMIHEGDPYAVELYKRYNQTEMPSFDFEDDKILKIITYLNKQDNEGCTKP